MEMVDHWFQPWPLGELLIARSPLGLRRVTWTGEHTHEEILNRLARELPDAQLVESSPDEEIRSEFEEFFAGRRTRFDLPVDPRPTSPFQERVLRRLMHTRAGEVISYGELATAVGTPGAARAVGRVMATNPLPIVIPCHRVVRTDRSLGHYTGGVAIKRFLLGLEGVHLEQANLYPQTPHPLSSPPSTPA